ncbi:winged helix-turn-helix domain-containing protein [Comamonas sp. GB3 AK4-5]|uniref:winged helix-turn-helix domain-containing protein n=1 Tax=Comamonas sp. GB3 AK4-5 TaxID=3231487 RepID=UPI00351DBD9E
MQPNAAHPRYRRMALACQGLSSTRPFGKGLAGTQAAIAHLGYVQIDTLAVVQRAHHHVLWARVPAYETGHLNQLVQKRQIFEHWFHAAAYLPMRDYRFALPRMHSIRSGEHPYFKSVDKKLMQELLARVRGEGALSMRELDTGRNGTSGSWWSWGPGRRALDKLFMQGDLMICERNGMGKVYALREQMLPAGMDLSEPSTEEYARYLLDTSLRAHGLVTWKQLLHLRTGKPLREAMRSLLAERVDAGQLLAVQDAGLDQAYVDAHLLDEARRPAPRGIRLLSPFDNLVIHRERLAALFGMDFRLECYVPAPQRSYGYFCLPLLWGDRLVGRMDCKAHRKEKRLQVLSLHLENQALDLERFGPQLRQALEKFAAFNDCEQIASEDARLQSWMK